MKHSRFLQIFLLTVLCLTISGLAEAGKGTHPEQFPYPSDSAYYESNRTNCEIIAYETGRFEVFFPSTLTFASITPADIIQNGIRVYLYDPTTMSNSLKKLISTQTSNLGVEPVGLEDPIVQGSSMTASADAKKATATVKINDSSLDDPIVPASIVASDIRDILASSGFTLKLGTWSATCAATRSN